MVFYFFTFIFFLFNIYQIFLLDWINYYNQSYVLASLNLNASKMNPVIWARSSNNTNAAEAAHALANREGKQFKLVFFSNDLLDYLIINYFLNNFFEEKKLIKKL